MKEPKFKGLIDFDATAQLIWEKKYWSVRVWAAASGFGTNVPSVAQIFSQTYPSPAARLPQKVVAVLREQGLAVEWADCVKMAA